MADNSSLVFLYSPESFGEWSYFLAEPLLCFKARKNKVSADGAKFVSKNPLGLLEKTFNQLRKKRRHDPFGPPFQGGIAGFLSYEALHYLEEVPFPKKDDVFAPWFNFLFFDAGIAFDPKGTPYYFGPENKRQPIRNAIEILLHADEIGKTGKIRSNFSKKAYLCAVRKIQEKIKAGETYQANLSQRFRADTEKSPWALFNQLTKNDPAPYSAFLQIPEISIVSNSPELLFRIKKGKILTSPIKGTRSRGKTDIEDTRLAKGMLNDEKEIAENAMIVDLCRNDLGKVCRPGTVKVSDAYRVEKFSHVQHLVSDVEGTLEKRKNAFDVLRAVFPGGSVTGCPKVRTMDILRDIEPFARGPYTGSMGWIGWNGDSAFNILIRTAYFKGNKKRKKVFFHAGGGIVYDSVPENEYRESLQKAEALFLALEQSYGKEGKFHD